MKKLIAVLFLSTSLAMAQQSVTLTAAAPQPISGLTTTVIGTAGSTSGCYWVVANYTGGSVLSQFSSCLTTIPNTLSNSNKVQIAFALVPNALTYDVLKTLTSVFPVSGTCTACLVGNVTVGLTTDVGNVLSNYTLAGFTIQSASATIRLNVQDFVTPTIEIVNASSPFQSAGGFIGLLTFNGVSDTFTTTNVVTLAQVNAGKIILPAVAGRTVKVVSTSMLPTGTFGGCTAVVLQDTSAVNVFSEAIAGLVNNVLINETSANTTLSTFGASLTTGQGLQIVKTGGACTTATSVLVIVKYTVN